VNDLIERLEGMLEGGQDNALLRFSLGNAYLAFDPQTAAEHLRRALEHDPKYSAAWKLLGQAVTQSGEKQAAVEIYQQGIEIAESNGDKQAAKEMQVFLKRILRYKLDT
jgi:Tfp pilus assembly protein PilF